MERRGYEDGLSSESDALGPPTSPPWPFSAKSPSKSVFASSPDIEAGCVVGVSLFKRSLKGYIGAFAHGPSR
jgi:hypothetical protein